MDLTKAFDIIDHIRHMQDYLITTVASLYTCGNTAWRQKLMFVTENQTARIFVDTFIIKMHAYNWR